MLSVVIPSHHDKYLHKTIASLLDNSRGDIEVIPVLDGYTPSAPVTTDPRVRIVRHERNMGMREAINTGVAAARGKYVMRTDEHCMFGPAYDTILLADIKDNWIVTPRRYELDPVKWEIIPSHPPVDYMKLLIVDKGRGYSKFSGVVWPSRTVERRDIPVDETMAMQGSCWVMPKSWWENVIGRLDSNGYGTHYQDSTEMLFKTWAADGKLMVNKNTWYAHRYRRFARTHNYPLAKAIPEFQFALDKHKDEYERIRVAWGV